MTAFLFLLIQAAPIPLKFFFIVGGVVVLIIGIVIFAYKTYLKSDEPTEDDLSALHIGTHATIPAKPVSPSPATRNQPPVIQQTAKLSTPAPVENKIVPPPIVMTEPPAPPPVVVAPPPPIPVAPPPPLPVQQTRPIPQRDMTSQLTEELPSNAPRTLASPVFAPTRPRQEAPQPPVSAPLTAPVSVPPAASIAYQPEPQPQTRQHVAEPEVFGSLTEVQRNQSRGNRFTLVILAIAIIGIFWVAYTQIPLFHDTVAGILGHSAPPPPPPQTPKIEIEPKVTLAGPALYVDGKVRNISDGTLENLYVEVSITYANGKLSETRLIPIFAGASQSPAASQTGKEPTPPKEDRTLPPSQMGHYKLDVPGSTFHDAQLKRILKEDGTEVMFKR